MPLYTYKKESTGETRDVFQRMNDEHKYYGEEGGEDDWKRVFLVPNASIDTKVDPYSNTDFVNKTGAKKGTMGDLLDLSAELSEQRASDNNGVDPVKEQYYENYAKARNGVRHLDEKKTFENKDVKVEY